MEANTQEIGSYLGVKFDQYISPIPVQSSDSNSEIWFRFLKLGSIGADSVSRRDKSGLGLAIYLWLFPVDTRSGSLFRCWRYRCRCPAKVGYRRIGCMRCCWPWWCVVSETRAQWVKHNGMK